MDLLDPKTYRVAGELRVCDTAPGDMFTKALTSYQEKLLLEVGHLVVVEPVEATADDAHAANERPERASRASTSSSSPKKADADDKE